MDDLHKPLGVDRKPARKNVALLIWGGLCLLAAAIVAGAYFLTDRDRAGPVVVAIQSDSETGQQASENGQAKTPEETGTSAGEPQTIKPLSPLEPLDPEEKPEAPVFKPQTPVIDTRAAGLPDPDLIEQSDSGPLPRISDGGVRPLDLYSEASGRASGSRIALVVGGLGLSQTGTQAAIAKLPSSVTLAFSPFGHSLQRWVQVARKEGHEVALQLPMEPLGYPAVDPGRQTLVSSASEADNIENLRWLLGRMTNYPVVTTYLGAGLLGRREAMMPILDELKDRGLGFLDDGSVQASKSLDFAEEIRLPHAAGSVVVDSVRRADVMRSQLQATELLARNRGYAIATASAFPDTVDLLANWVEEAGKRGIIVVPLSSLIRDYPR